MHCTDAVVPSYSTKKQRLSQLRKVFYFYFFCKCFMFAGCFKTHFKKSLLIQQGRLILLKPRFINCYFPCKMAIFSFIITLLPPLTLRHIGLQRGENAGYIQNLLRKLHIILAFIMLCSALYEPFWIVVGPGIHIYCVYFSQNICHCTIFKIFQNKRSKPKKLEDQFSLPPCSMNVPNSIETLPKFNIQRTKQFNSAGRFFNCHCCSSFLIRPETIIKPHQEHGISGGNVTWSSKILTAEQQKATEGKDVFVIIR